MQMSQIQKQTGTRMTVSFRVCVKHESRSSLCMSCLCSLGASSKAGLSELHRLSLRSAKATVF